MLENLLRNGKVLTYFDPVNKKYNKSICYLNKTRIKVNTDCCDRFLKENIMKKSISCVMGRMKNIRFAQECLLWRHKTSKTEKYPIQGNLAWRIL